MPATTHPEFNLQPNAYVIRALTNLHAGAGGESYGMIDNLVQRDKASGLPVIHSSSLKGSLRELMEDGLNYQETDPSFIQKIFGGDKARPGQTEGKGSYKFLEAEILSIPVRSDHKLFYSVTCPKVCERLIEQSKKLKFSLGNDLETGLAGIGGIITDANSNFHFDNTPNEVILEEEDITAVRYTGTIAFLDKVKKLLGADLAIVNNNHFQQLTDNYHLPVIARNHLENGISENLWYEQVLPRETRMFFFLLSPKDDTHLFSFVSNLENNPVQIGANASVGYGYCEIKKLSTILT